MWVSVSVWVCLLARFSHIFVGISLCLCVCVCVDETLTHTVKRLPCPRKQWTRRPDRRPAWLTNPHPRWATGLTSRLAPPAVCIGPGSSADRAGKRSPNTGRNKKIHTFSLAHKKAQATHTHTDTQTDRQTDRQPYQTDRQTNRQAERKKKKKKKKRVFQV